MALTESSNALKVITTTSNNLNKLQQVNGQMIFVSDEQKIYFDYKDERKPYSSTLIQKTFTEWLNESDKVFPAGTILVYTDRTVVDGEYAPDIKIADGKTAVKDLPFTIERKIESVLEGIGFEKREDGTFVFQESAKVSHKLVIGDYSYDGSEEVVIPVYKGESVIG